MSFFLKMFLTSNESFYITEFGHSEHKRPKTVGPWSREIYILILYAGNLLFQKRVWRSWCTKEH